jgi:hypothetical protein
MNTTIIRINKAMPIKFGYPNISLLSSIYIENVINKNYMMMMIIASAASYHLDH